MVTLPRRHRPLRTAGRAAAALAAVAITAGCAGSSAAEDPAMAAGLPGLASPSLHSAGAWDTTTMPDPCRTVQSSEVTAILGVPVTRTSNTQSWPPLCVFALAGATEFLYVSDNSQASGHEDYKNELAISAGAQQVPGLGGSAFWAPDSHQLNVMTGSSHVVVKYGGTPLPAQAKEKAIAIARIALPRATAPTAG